MQILVSNGGLGCQIDWSGTFVLRGSGGLVKRAVTKIERESRYAESGCRTERVTVGFAAPGVGRRPAA